MKNNTIPPINRRQFLKALGFWLGAIPLRPVLKAEAWLLPAKTSAPKNIIIVGAGLAGLSAAYELKKAGHSVRIFEARNRAGGRVLTLKENFDDGLYAEAGGEWIDNTHGHLLHYINEFGLNLLYERFENRSDEDEGEAEPNDVQLLLEQFIAQINPFIHDQPSLPELDQLSFKEFLIGQNVSRSAIAELDNSFSQLMAIAIDKISALHMFNELALPEIESSYKIEGGNETLPKTLAARLGSLIEYNAPVRRISHDDSGIAVTVEHNGQTIEAAADHVIIAAPFTTVRKMDFSPKLPERKMAMIHTLGYGQIMKVVMQFKTRFWETEGFMRYRFPGMKGSVYESSAGQPGQRGLLTAYIPDHDGIKIARLNTKSRINTILGKMRAIHPSAGKQFEKGDIKWWQEDEWAQGTYAYFKPGEITSIRPFIAQAVGRIHFAGEHTAKYQGYMQGAVESGWRAAREIDESSSMIKPEHTIPYPYKK